MPLSDDDKKLLQQEISILTQDQKDLLSSLKEARMELRTEVAERLAVHQKLVQELEIYKWVIRFLFVILLGGSIYGILNFGSFVDARIADRMKRSDKLSQALSCAQLGQWEPALQTFDEVFYDYKAANSFPDRDYLEFLYSKWIWILAQADLRQNLNSWVGESEWKTLNGESQFREGFLGSPVWKHDEQVLTNLAYCTLKFDRSKEALANARSYFDKAFTATRARQSDELRADTAPHLVQLAMIDLIEGNQPQANKDIEDAAQADPAVLTRDLDSFEKSTDFAFWDVAAKRAGINDFGQRLRDLYKSVPRSKKSGAAWKSHERLGS